MTALEMVGRLQELVEHLGSDCEVLIDTNPFELVAVEDVDVDCERDVIVIWPGEVSEVELLTPGEGDARD